MNVQNLEIIPALDGLKVRNSDLCSVEVRISDEIEPTPMIPYGAVNWHEYRTCLPNMNPKQEEARLLIQAVAAQETDIDELSIQLQSVGGLRALAWCGAEVLDGVLSPSAVQRVEHLLYVAEQLNTPPGFSEPIDNAAAVAAFFRPRLASLRAESFWGLFLDARGRVLGFECVAKGSLTACLVHPREVFGPAIRARAAQLVLVHNHPSGDPCPSPEDLSLTERLTEVGLLMGIPVVDHIIVAAQGFRSVGCGPNSE